MADGVSPELFYHADHLALYRDLVRIHADYGAVPSENLPVYLLPANQPTYYDLLEIASSSTAAPEIKKLTELAERRRIIAAAERTAAEAKDPERPIKRAEAPSPWSPALLSPARYFDHDPPEFQFIVPGLLARGLVGFLYGEGGSYKSLAALWLCMQRASGEIIADSKWLGKFPVTFGRSIFFSAEDVDADLHHRVRAIAAAMHARRPEVPEESIAREVSDNCLVVSREQWTQDGELFLLNEDGSRTGKIDAVIDIIRDFGADLAIFETYSRIFNVDEIDSRLAARAVGIMENVRDATQSGIEIIAHTAKSNRSGQTDTHGLNALRGAGALADNARHGLWFKSLPTVEERPRLEVINSKSFRCKRTEPFRVSIDYPVFSLDESIDPGISPKTNKERKAVVDSMRQSGPMAFSELTKAIMHMGKSQASAKRWVGDMIHMEMIRKGDDGLYTAVD